MDVFLIIVTMVVGPQAHEVKRIKYPMSSLAVCFEAVKNSKMTTTYYNERGKMLLVCQQKPTSDKVNP